MIQDNNTKKENINPVEVPKKSLKTAPVYPIMADTSSCSRIRIRLKSMGLRALNAIIGFSKG
jgi:hypothetical protein